MVVVETYDLSDYLPLPTANTALSPGSRSPVPTGSLRADLGTDRSVHVSTQGWAPDVALGVFTSHKAVPPSLSACHGTLRPIADSPPDCVVICCSGGGGGWPFSGSGRSGTGSGSGGLFYIERCCHPGRHQWARSHVTFSGVVRPAGGVTCPST